SEYLEGKELQLGVQGSANVVRHAEAVALLRKQNVADGGAAAAQGFDHKISLVGWDNGVVGALEEDDGPRDRAGEVKRRTLPVSFLILRIWTDQPVEIVGLELVRVLCEPLQIADAIVTGAAFEVRAEGQRGERRVTPGAASADDRPLPVGPTLLHDILGAVNAVVDVDDAPVEVQPIAVFAAVAGAAAVVHVENGNAAAGPKLNAKVKCTPRGGGGSAMTFHDQRRLFTFFGGVVWIGRRIEETVGFLV